MALPDEPQLLSDNATFWGKCIRVALPDEPQRPAARLVTAWECIRVALPDEPQRLIREQIRER